MTDKPAFIQEINAYIEKYGNERDALNHALAQLQEARAWIIAQEKCPGCFDDIYEEERRSPDGYISFYWECRSCSRAWLTIGVEIAA